MAAQSGSHSRSSRPAAAVRVARPAVALLALGLWIGYVELWDLPSYFLPHPFAVARKFAALAASGLLLEHVAATLQEVILGFALGTAAALILGTLISRSLAAEQVLRPYIIASQTTPTLVLAPLFLVWFGFGLTSKVLIATIICFFPLLVNVMIGFRSIGESERRLFRSLQASAWQTFLHLEVPSALPFIFAGLRITSLLSVIGAVVGEFVGARAGLGYLAITAAGNLETEILLSAVFSLMLMGLSFYGLITLLERRILFWHQSVRR